MNQETRDRIEEHEQEYFERRIDELSGEIPNRAAMFEQINRELDDIRSRRNEP